MLANRRTGWIGIDVGTSTVKLVQLTRSRNRIRLAGTAIVPRHQAWSDSELSDSQPRSSVDELLTASSLNSNFRGKRAAAVLPMSVCDFFSFDQPSVHPTEQKRAVRQAIELATQRSAAHLQYDYWDAEKDPKNPKSTKSNVLTVARNWSDQVCEDVLKSGWCCQTIDGLPLALARAVSLVEKNNQATPIAALDWGYGRATLCIISEGRPVYVRCLKECNLQLLLDTLTEELDITSEEAQNVLQKYGLKNQSDSEEDFSEGLIEEIASSHLTRLENEICRTISHLKGLRRTIVPKKLYVFGGGATIQGLANHLSRKLALQTQIWQFGSSSTNLSQQPNLPSCLFGPAIALSSLAWEQQ